MAELISSFPPVIGSDPRVLILGSMPGVESLRQQQYYAHPRNSFWPIIAALTGEELTEEYEDRALLLKRHGIALWDVIASCSRQGSLDQHIQNPQPNDVGGLLGSYPSIRSVFCNGAKSYQLFKRYIACNESVAIHRLPSTSPAHAVAFEKKLESWLLLKTLMQC